MGAFWSCCLHLPPLGGAGSQKIQNTGPKGAGEKAPLPEGGEGRQHHQTEERGKATRPKEGGGQAAPRHTETETKRQGERKRDKKGESVYLSGTGTQRENIFREIERYKKRICLSLSGTEREREREKERKRERAPSPAKKAHVEIVQECPSHIYIYINMYI